MNIEYLEVIHNDRVVPGAEFSFSTRCNFKMAETDVLEVEVDDRADFTEDTGEGILKES